MGGWRWCFEPLKAATLQRPRGQSRPPGLECPVLLDGLPMPPSLALDALVEAKKLRPTPPSLVPFPALWSLISDHMSSPHTPAGCPWCASLKNNLSSISGTRVA
jgi:hypothetical protein